MRSLTQYKKGMVSGAAAILLGSSLFLGQASAATVIAGGDVPLINTVLAQGNSGLDFSIDGATVVVASFVINNNAPNTFTFQIGLAGGGRFYTNGDITAGVDWTASALQVAATQPTGSALGTGATALVTAVTPTPGTAAPAAGSWAAGTQTTATINYKVELVASWTADATLLAGNYSEVVTASLTANM